VDGFTEEQKALIEKVAWTVGDGLQKRFEQQLGQALALHAAQCPTSRRVDRAFWALAGAALFGGLTGGGMVTLLRMLL